VVEDGKAVERLIKIGVTNGPQVEVVGRFKSRRKNRSKRSKPTLRKEPPGQNTGMR